jgi:hypothetical protein
MLKLDMKIVSSLEKCFWDQHPEEMTGVGSFTVFRNERLCFQVAYRAECDEINARRDCTVRLGGELAGYATLRQVCNVLNMYPTYNVIPEGEFLRTQAGAYPDMIRPLMYPDMISVPDGQTHALWVEIELPEGFAVGEYGIELSAYAQNECIACVSASVRVLDASLPEQTLIHTEWLHTDCIANYYHCKAFSERHWKLLESYVRVAVRNGINMILTPVFTPEIDTYIGGERLTTQLVDIELGDDGKFAFGFEKLDRWIDMCLSCGVKYFEMPHFFTQWGAKAAPKIVVKVCGKKKKYFGWHTDAAGQEYESFLSQFIPALVAKLRARGLDGKCFFHVSDEPHLDQIEQYKRCKQRISRYLDGFPIIDALSDFEFYSSGVLEKPVPNTRNAKIFADANVPGLWTYYCGAGKGGVSDRSLAMPSWRTRILGVQLYYYDIEGFLHWGYNFYNSWNSYCALDPYGHADGGYFMPTGDCFVVYPGTDGQAWESLRLNALREAMDDIRALRWYEQRFGREATRKMISELAGGTFTFTEYPAGPEFLQSVRRRITDAALAQA